MKFFLSSLAFLAVAASGFVLGVIGKTHADGSSEDHECCECLNPKK